MVYWQTYPETQVVEPLYPCPPPRKNLPLATRNYTMVYAMRIRLTLSPGWNLSRDGDNEGQERGGDGDLNHFADFELKLLAGKLVKD